MTLYEKIRLGVRIRCDLESRDIGPGLISRLAYDGHLFLHKSKPESATHAYKMGVDVVEWIIETLDRGNNAN